MYDFCNSIIEILPSYDVFYKWSKVFASPIATIFIGLLVFWYTNSHHKRTMLNSLDSKSEWRKKLFEIAGKRDIRLDDVYQLRAALRFNRKNVNDKKLSTFDKVNIIIIEYCKTMTNENNIDNIVYDKQLKLHEKEIIRLFCRYLLADHWEKNHNRNHIFEDNKKEKELCNYTLRQFNQLFEYTKNKSNNENEKGKQNNSVDFEMNFSEAKKNLKLSKENTLK